MASSAHESQMVRAARMNCPARSYRSQDETAAGSSPRSTLSVVTAFTCPPPDRMSRPARRLAKSAGSLYVVFCVATRPMRSVMPASAESCDGVGATGDVEIEDLPPAPVVADPRRGRTRRTVRARPS